MFPSSFLIGPLGTSNVLGEPAFLFRASALVCFSLGASSVVPVRIEDRTCGCHLCGEEALSAGGKGGLEGDGDVWSVSKAPCDPHTEPCRARGKICTPAAVSPCLFSPSFLSAPRLFLQLPRSLLCGEVSNSALCEESLVGDGVFLFLDCGGKYMTIGLCQKHP